MTKVITCRKCSGLGTFVIRDYRGDTRIKPTIERILCTNCRGKKTEIISVEK